MPFSFLVPAFLAGLAALAIPLLIHLTRRQTEQQTAFPSLMFVKRIEQPKVRRRRIRNLLLLLVRAAAVAIIVAAFARPFFDRPEAPIAATGGGREVVLLLDRSYSMGYGDRWERAQEAARGVIDGLGPADRATLLVFDEDAEIMTRTSRERGLLRGALDAVEPSSAATRYAPALKLAESVLGASPLPRREIVLISDFQRTGWNEEEGAGSVNLPAGTQVVPLSVAEPGASNVAVADVSFLRESQQGRERVVATARVVNRGAEAVADLPVTLEVNGRPVERRRASLEPNGSAEVRFAALTLSEANTRGVVRAGEDALAADNEFRFVLSPGEALGVLVVEGPTTPPDASLFLTRALSIGQDPGFRVDVVRSTGFTAGDLAGRAVVVLNDAALPEGAAGERLREFVERGGGLVVVAGPNTAERAWGREAAQWVGARAGGPVEQPTSAGTALGYVDYSHPVFELFTSPRSGDIAAARFFGYRPLAGADSSRVLARFGDGSPALVETRVGQGRVLVWGSSVDDSWTDFPLQPVFLPFTHQLVRHAAGYAPPAGWLTVGQVVGAAATAGGAPPALALAPSGERLELDGAPLRVREQGFYELRRGSSGEELARVVAVNVNPAEADLTALDPQQLASSLAAASTAPTGAAGVADPSTRPERERQQAIWWYLLVFALILLATDTVLANRLSRPVRST